MSFPRYPKYKASGVEWLGEVPEHWEIKRLRNISKTRKGRLPEGTSSVPTAETDLPYLSMEFLRGEAESAAFVAESANLIRAEDKDILLLWDGSNAGEFLRAKRGVVSSTVALIEPEGVTRDYLFFTCKACERRLKEQTVGMGIPHVSGDELRSTAIPLPPLPEQTAIAAFLDRETGKIDGLVAEQRRLMELLKEKRQAVISHAVTRGLPTEASAKAGLNTVSSSEASAEEGAPLKDSGIDWLGQVPAHWRVGKAGFYLTILSGYAFPSSGFSEDETNPKLLRGINVGVGRLKWEETVFWPRVPNDGLDIYEMKEGDLVIGMDRPLIADGIRVAKVQKADLPCLLLQRVASIQVGSQLHADYLLALLGSEMFVAHFLPETTGVSVPHISPEQIHDFVIPIPPLAEQTAIVAHLEQELANFDTLTAEAQRAIDLLQERRTALISAAVTGQIDVRDDR